MLSCGSAEGGLGSECRPSADFLPSTHHPPKMVCLKNLHHGVGDPLGVVLFGKLLKGEDTVFLRAVMDSKNLEMGAGFAGMG